MDESSDTLTQLATTSRRLVRRLLTIGENRLELLTVEVQEERERLLHAFLLSLCVAAFGLLAGITFTAAIAVLFWDCWPVVALAIMAILYGAAGFWVWRRLAALLGDWQTFSATMDQLRKDRACLERQFP